MPASDYIYEMLIRNLPFTPTGDQDNLLHTMADFIIGQTDILIVNGYAGTGKSSAMAALTKTAKELDMPCVLLAPTGRSAKVLASYTGKEAFTIHKKIYWQKSQSADEENEYGVFTLTMNKVKDGIFIVDEASLISNTPTGNSNFGSGCLLDDLIEFVRSNTGNKLVLLGDGAQLPPIGLSVSPALNPEYMRNYGDFYYVTLRQVVRQAATSGILYNATKLRVNIAQGISTLPEFETDGYTDIEKISGSELIDTLSDAYDKYGEENVAVLCRSNKRAVKYNLGIRSSVCYREEQLCKGDRVMIVKNCYAINPEDAEDMPLSFIANGDMAELVRIRQYTERYGLNFANATLRFPDYNNIELDMKIILDTLLSETPSLPEELQKQLYMGVWADYENIKSKKKRYKAVREDPFMNALQIKYAEAITCHKSQGGQWSVVFVDKGFGESEESVETLRWYYTALTRAKEKLYLVNFK